VVLRLKVTTADNPQATVNKNNRFSGKCTSKPQAVTGGRYDVISTWCCLSNAATSIP